MVDNRDSIFPNEQRGATIARWCHRKFGIGADGLILLENDPEADFRMVYFNADGQEGSMCGNGGRCIVAFAQSLGIIQNHTRFRAVDGWHEAQVEGSTVELRMSDVQVVQTHPGYWTLDTGSPHYVAFVENVEEIDAYQAGQEIRYSPTFRDKGINVNWVEVQNGLLKVRTYERGVEDETLSCGTGVTAAAIVHTLRQGGQTGEIRISTQGGGLSVKLGRNSRGHFTHIWLCGPTRQVFRGVMDIEPRRL